MLAEGGPCRSGVSVACWLYEIRKGTSWQQHMCCCCCLLATDGLCCYAWLWCPSQPTIGGLWASCWCMTSQMKPASTTYATGCATLSSMPATMSTRYEQTQHAPGGGLPQHTSSDAIVRLSCHQSLRLGHACACMAEAVQRTGTASTPV
jgi:hypothetical protein